MIGPEISARNDRLVESTLSRSGALQILRADGRARSIGTRAVHVAIYKLNVVGSLKQDRFESQARIQIAAIFIENAHVRPFHDELPIGSGSQSPRGNGAVGPHNEVVPERRNQGRRNCADRSTCTSDGLRRQRSILEFRDRQRFQAEEPIRRDGNARIGEIDVAKQHEIEWQRYGRDRVIVVVECQSCAATSITRIDEVETGSRKIGTGWRRCDREYWPRYRTAENRNGYCARCRVQRHDGGNAVHCSADDSRGDAVELYVDVLGPSIEMITLDHNLSRCRST